MKKRSNSSAFLHYFITCFALRDKRVFRDKRSRDNESRLYVNTSDKCLHGIKNLHRFDVQPLQRALAHASVSLPDT